MSKDYLSFHAVKPWDIEEQREPSEHPLRHWRGGDTAEQVRCCLNCTMAECNNCMEYVPKGALPETRGVRIAPKRAPKKTEDADPCIECNAKLLCQIHNWTCSAKTKWEVQHG